MHAAMTSSLSTANHSKTVSIINDPGNCGGRTMCIAAQAKRTRSIINDPGNCGGGTMCIAAQAKRTRINDPGNCMGGTILMDWAAMCK